MIWIINGKPFKENFSYYRTRSIRLDEEDEYFHRYNPLAQLNGTKPRRDEFSFTWSRCRRSWSDARRQIFIDFGKDILFQVQEGIGTKSGTGKPISKEEFLKMHGGDLRLLETLIDKQTD